MNTNKQRHIIKTKMNDEELEQAIEDMVGECEFVHIYSFGMTLDGTFTPAEIVAIAELLKKEGRV